MRDQKANRPAVVGALALAWVLVFGACSSPPRSRSLVEEEVRKCLAAQGIDIADIQIDVDVNGQISGSVGVVNGGPAEPQSPEAALDLCARQLGLPGL